MKRVLVVDDTVFMRQTLKNFLGRNGYEVVGEAEDGADAIEKYKELQPDAVTMDITMPRMNGIDAVKNIVEYDKKAKIIMISAMGQEDMVKQSIIMGAKSFIVKPFKEEQIISVFHKLIGV
jgi:two-component system chemotaxis response regulator CheY